MEKRLNNRTVVHSGNLNPFIEQDSYIENINKQDNYLRPKNSKEINNLNEEKVLKK